MDPNGKGSLGRASRQPGGATSRASGKDGQHSPPPKRPIASTSQAPSQAASLASPSQRPAADQTVRQALSRFKGQQGQRWQPRRWSAQQLAGRRGRLRLKRTGAVTANPSTRPQAQRGSGPEDGRSDQGQGQQNQLTQQPARRTAKHPGRGVCNRAWPGEQHAIQRPALSSSISG